MTPASFQDNIAHELDSRKLEALAQLGVELTNIPILSVSACCEADMIGDSTRPDIQLRCSACHKPCQAVEGTL